MKAKMPGFFLGTIIVTLWVHVRRGQWFLEQFLNACFNDMTLDPSFHSLGPLRVVPPMAVPS